ncbi:MAG: S26 family signal peptidase [Pseudonocardia sp.]|nr:S26 family signal peptidase [Pseudonocardia sp.]
MSAGTALAGLGSAVAALALARRGLTVVTVTSGSMAPTLAAGDRALVRRCGGSAVRRGDVVLALLPPAGHAVVLPEPTDSTPSDVGHPHPEPDEELEFPDRFVKRVVALPDDVLLRDDLLAMLAPGRRPPDDLPHGWRIPPHSCFVLGDGVESGDSLTWGPLPLPLVVGKVVARAPAADESRWQRVPASPWTS